MNPAGREQRRKNDVMLTVLLMWAGSDYNDEYIDLDVVLV